MFSDNLLAYTDIGSLILPSKVKEPLTAFGLKLRKRPKIFFIKKRGILLGSAQFLIGTW